MGFLIGMSAVCSEYSVQIDSLETLKDMSDSIQGADAESFMISSEFPAGVNLRRLLNEQREEFAAAMKEIGCPVLRMADMCRYSWESPDITKMLQGGNKDTDYWWYSPKDFHKFCKDNKIKIIGFLDTYRWYDDKLKTVIDLRDPKTKLVKEITPAQLESLLAANRKKLEWVRDNGYADLYVAWEIGNENYYQFREAPALYAKMALALTKMAKEVIPQTRTSVCIFVCAADDENLTRDLDKSNPASITDMYDRWRTWSSCMLDALGDDAKIIYYGAIHLYGFQLRYNANNKGLTTHARFVDAHPNAKHFRFIATEWRHTSGDDLIGHRMFKTAALWKAKFTLDLLAHPRIDYTSVHEFTTFSGLLYVNDGKVWRCQSKNKTKPIVPYASKPGSPALEIGPFGPVMKMANELVEKYPFMIARKSGLGETSSVVFAEQVEAGSISDDGLDIDYLIAASKAHDSAGGIVVNTFTQPVSFSLKGKMKFSIYKARSFNCPVSNIFDITVPGDKQPWSIVTLQANADGMIVLPPCSVTFFEAKKQTGSSN